MLRQFIGAVLTALCMALSPCAHAATFLFNCSNSFVTCQGTITTGNLQADGSYHITSLVGSAIDRLTGGGSQAITLSGWNGGDNTFKFDSLYPGNVLVNLAGVSFDNALGTNYNIFYDGSTRLTSRYFPGPGKLGELTTFALTQTSTGAVPEPAGWLMLIFGFGLLGMALRTANRISRRMAIA